MHEARATCSFQRERWIWQIHLNTGGRFRVFCQTSNTTSKEAGMLRAEVVRMLAACDMPKQNINLVKKLPWLSQLIPRACVLFKKAD